MVHRHACRRVTGVLLMAPNVIRVLHAPPVVRTLRAIVQPQHVLSLFTHIVSMAKLLSSISNKQLIVHVM